MMNYRLPYKVTQTDWNGVAVKSCAFRALSFARRGFANAVKQASDDSHIRRVTLWELSPNRPDSKHDEWVRDDVTLKDEVEVRLSYKIHGFHVANGRARSTQTEKFYETEEAATEAAEGMARRSANSSNAQSRGVVIYKAIKIIRPVKPVVEIETIDL